MAAFDYGPVRATVEAVLGKFGKALILTRKGNGGDLDPLTGKKTGGVDLPRNGVGVVTRFARMEIDGDAVLSTDKKLLWSGDSLAVGDIYDGLRVHDLHVVDPNQTGDILTVAQMRK